MEYFVLFRRDNLVKCLHFTKSVCQLCIISQLFIVSPRRLRHIDVFILSHLGTFITLYANVMTLSTIKREPWWFFLRHRISFYRKSINMLDCDVTTLNAGVP